MSDYLTSNYKLGPWLRGMFAAGEHSTADMRRTVRALAYNRGVHMSRGQAVAMWATIRKGGDFNV